MRFNYLKSLGIPFEIQYNDQIVDLLMRIAESRPFLLDHLSKPLKLSLLRSAKVAAVTYSNQIEGNTLSEEQVKKLISKRKRDLSDTEVTEVQNYSDALDYAEKLATDSRPLRISDFCDLQRMITENLIAKNQLGRIRAIPVSIANSATGEVIDTVPEPHHLQPALDDLWNWLDETSSANPYLRAFAFHFIAVAIHPFADGNGRTCRLMQHLLLLKSGEDIVRYVPSETAILRNRDAYYRAIRQTKKLGRLEPILVFLATCFAESAEEITKEAKFALRKSDLSKEGRRSKVLKLLQRKKEIRISDVIEMFPSIGRRTLERDIETLCKEKKIKAKGERRARTYILMRKSGTPERT